jgi:hypothetical protein
MVATLQNIYVFEIERILSPGSGPGGNTSGPVAHSKPLAFTAPTQFRNAIAKKIVDSDPPGGLADLRFP